MKAKCTFCNQMAKLNEDEWCKKCAKLLNTFAKTYARLKDRNYSEMTTILAQFCEAELIEKHGKADAQDMLESINNIQV